MCLFKFSNWQRDYMHLDWEQHKAIISISFMMHLKEYFNQNWKFCHCLLALYSFQTS